MKNIMTQAKTVNLYEQDYVAWADEQALLLEQKRFNELDLVNLVEEVRDLGRRERDAIESQLTRLLMHLLKWHYQPEKRTRSWLLTIKDARRQIAKLRSKYPVLKVHSESVFFECYLEAREVASDETALSLNVFPLDPYSFEQVLDTDFFPGDTDSEVDDRDREDHD